MVQGGGEARPHGHPGPLRLGAAGSGSPRAHPMVVLWGETPAVGSPGREHREHREWWVSQQRACRLGAPSDHTLVSPK